MIRCFIHASLDKLPSFMRMLRLLDQSETALWLNGIDVSSSKYIAGTLKKGEYVLSTRPFQSNTNHVRQIILSTMCNIVVVIIPQHT